MSESRLTTTEDIVAVLENTSQRMNYQELLDSLRANGRPALGVKPPLEDLARAGRVRLTDPKGEPWLDQYGMEPDFPGYQDGPLYVELCGA